MDWVQKQLGKLLYRSKKEKPQDSGAYRLEIIRDYDGVFRYRWRIYYRGAQVASGSTDTRWGAKMEAGARVRYLKKFNRQTNNGRDKQVKVYDRTIA